MTPPLEKYWLNKMNYTVADHDGLFGYYHGPYVNVEELIDKIKKESRQAELVITHIKRAIEE